MTIFILNLEKNKETKVNITVPSTARFLQGEIFSNADLQTISQMLVILCILVKKYIYIYNVTILAIKTRLSCNFAKRFEVFNYSIHLLILTRKGPNILF